MAAHRVVKETQHLTVRNMTDFFTRHLENRSLATAHGAATLWTYPEASQAMTTIIQNGKFTGPRNNNSNGKRSNNSGGGNPNRGNRNNGNRNNGNRQNNPSKRQRTNSNGGNTHRQLTSTFGTKTLCMNWNKGNPCGGEIEGADLYCTKPQTSDDRYVKALSPFSSHYTTLQKILAPLCSENRRPSLRQEAQGL